MDPVTALAQCGGVASTAQLKALTTRKALRHAVAKGRVIHVARDRYALPSEDLGLRLAAEHDAHLRLLSAALHWQWEVKTPPMLPQLVTRRRGLAVPKAELVVEDLSPSALDGWATSPLQTVLDCAEALPFDEALAVADSALRSGDLSADDLARVGGDTRVARVLAHADERAHNPFESVLRALLIEGGFSFVPQWESTCRGVTFHPDLADPVLGIAVEADSWGFHATKESHDRDCRRYNDLTVSDWLVLRFTWHDVMRRPQYVLATVQAAVDLRRGAA